MAILQLTCRPATQCVPLLDPRTCCVRPQAYPNSRALVLSTENITQNWYFGEDRSMLIPNCLFRVGGAGIVLSNRCRLLRGLRLLLSSCCMRGQE